MKGVLRVRLYYGGWRTAIEGSLRIIPAHGKNRVVTQNLLTGTRYVCKGMRLLQAWSLFLLNATRGRESSDANEGRVGLPSRSDYHRFYYIHVTKRVNAVR